MHIGSILVFGPKPGGEVPTLAEVRAYLAARLEALPRYTERLAGTSAGRFTWQRWERDPDFAIARHVGAVTLNPPGGWDELLAWAGDYFSMRLERDRPLWDVMMVHGLAYGHWALVTKTHHCLVDGVGSVEAAHLLLDGVAEALGTPETNGAHPDPSRRLSPALGAVVHGIGAGLHAATHPYEMARRAAALGSLLLHEEIQAAPDSSINDPIGPRRILRGVTVDLDEVRLVKRALGGTVNDVVLTSVSAGLRALLLERGEEPPVKGLRAMVPMNVRRDDDGALGNRISSLFVDLPVAERHPLARYEKVRETTEAIKGSSQPLGADSLLHVTGLAPPVVHQLLARTLFAKRLFNVTVTNVPGIQARLSAMGAPLKAVWPLVPIADDHAVGIAVVSYAGRLTFGIVADRESVPDIDVIASGIADGLAELQRIAHGVAPVLVG